MDKTILAVCGVLFAIGGGVSAFLQAKWLRDQRKTLRGILDVLHAMRESGIKTGLIVNPVTPSPDAQGVSHDASHDPGVRAVIVHEEVGNAAFQEMGRVCSGNGGAGHGERPAGWIGRAAHGTGTRSR